MIATSPTRLSRQQQRVRQLAQACAPSPYRVRAVVEVTGPLDPERLRAALRQTIADTAVLHAPLDPVADDRSSHKGSARGPHGIDRDGAGAAHDAIAGAARAGTNGGPYPHAATAVPHHARAVLDASLLVGPALDDASDGVAAIASAVWLVAPARAMWALQASAFVSDEQTLRLLVERTVDVYRHGAKAAGLITAMSYADYVDWQHDLMLDPDTAAAREYWAQQPCPDPSRQRLPLPYDGSDRTTFTPGRLTRWIDADLAGSLTQGARAARVDLSTWLLAAWQVVLWRHLDTPDVQVGLGLDGRAHPALTDVLGPCARYVPVCTAIASRASLAEIARSTAAIVREHEVWQDCCSWEAFKRTAADIPEPTYHAFGFDWRTGSGRVVGGRAAGRDTTFRIASLFATQDRFDVRLTARRAGRRVECLFEWNRAHLDEVDVGWLADRYLTLVTDAAQHPEAGAAELAIVGPAERQQLSARARGPEPAAPVDGVIHREFERQVALDGTRTAVIAGASRLSYGDLDRRAAAVAVRLRAEGLTPGARVAICLPRTADQFVVMLGVLKAGGAFVPLDPAVPWERLAWMVADAKASVLFTSTEGAARVPPDAGVRVLVPDDGADGPDGPDDVGTSAAASAYTSASASPSTTATADVSAHADANADVDVHPGSPAYVIYTSGSTGKPKGVVVSHRNLVHSTDARRTYYRRPVGTYLLVSPLAFDSAMAGVFWALCSGGTLVLPADDEHHDPVALRRLIEQHRVTHALCLPSLYAWVLDAERIDVLRSLQVVIVAGESCPSALSRRHRQLLPRVELHNEYGPTECSVWSTAYRAGSSDEESGVPIGRPIARAQVYVADRPWQLSPSWCSGEGLIGGAGVADGYLDRPALTAERFVPDPWSGRPGARLYRTGDRMRWVAGSQLEFLGRIDHQVKLRGYRIELEDVEAAIGAHADIRECVVTIRRDEPGGERLVAYVVPNAPGAAAAGAVGVTGGASAPGAADATGAGGATRAAGDAGLAERLRAFLVERLPPYMVPAPIVPLDALPKTPNGKVDRGRLPAPPRATADVPSADPPSTPSEMTVAAAWRELLGREHIGVYDNFFDLGGHSMMAIAIFNRLQSTIAPRLRLVDLFERPTVHALAEFIDGLTSSASSDAEGDTPAAAGAGALAAAEETAAVIDDVRARQQALRRRRVAARAS